MNVGKFCLAYIIDINENVRIAENE